MNEINNSASHSPPRVPLHERIAPIRYLRRRLRDGLYGFLSKLLATDDGRSILSASLNNQYSPRPDNPIADLLSYTLPYSDLGLAQSPTQVRDEPIFITARFRSGSTLLWNLFRQVPRCTSYYEPFNERQWFNPAVRRGQTDPTHRGIKEYWREYDGLERLGKHYRAEWTFRDLHMDAQSVNPGMKRYVETLIESAPGRPVLQFNRIDFRLAWFRQHFPNATILHLYRHPRDQWCSCLVDLHSVPRDIAIREFEAHDHYYLRNWARDLKYNFPFLDETVVTHPYQLFYMLWKLSYLYGRRYAHRSIAFEQLVDAPEASLDDLFRFLNISEGVASALVPLVERPRSGRWKEYASEDWFQSQEAASDRLISDYLGGPCTNGSLHPVEPYGNSTRIICADK